MSGASRHGSHPFAAHQVVFHVGISWPYGGDTCPLAVARSSFSIMGDGSGADDSSLGDTEQE